MRTAGGSLLRGPQLWPPTSKMFETWGACGGESPEGPHQLWLLYLKPNPHKPHRKKGVFNMGFNGAATHVSFTRPPLSQLSK